MRQALNILGRGLADLWDNLFVLAIANLVWALSLVPGVGLATFVNGGLGLSLGLLMLVLLTAPTTLALYSFTIEINRREKVEFGEFWRGLKQYYRRGWVIGLLNVAFVVLSFFNLTFYLSPSIANSPLWLIVIVWGYIAFSWFCMQLYIWPLAVRMDKFKLGGLLRNAFLGAFKYPILTLILSVVMGAFFVVSYLLAFLPVILIGMTYYAIISNKALTVVLEKEQERLERLKNNGEDSPPFQVDVPPLPELEPEEKPVFTTRNTPPGVKRRGISETKE